MAVSKDFDLTGRNVLICVPAYDGKVPVEFMMAYLETIGECHARGVSVHMEVRMGCALIQKARNDLAHTALERTEITDILFIDSDIYWKADDVLRLLAWGTDYPFVSGCYPVKQDEPMFHIYPTAGPDGKIIQNEYGLIKANGVPGGFLSLRPEVFHRIKAHKTRKHWWSRPQPLVQSYVPRKGDHKDKTVINFFDCMHENDMFIGEDIAFCKRWLRSGGEIWVDPAVSVKHIGAKTYEHTMIDYLTSKAEDNGQTQEHINHPASA